MFESTPGLHLSGGGRELGGPPVAAVYLIIEIALVG